MHMFYLLVAARDIAAIRAEANTTQRLTKRR